MTLISKYAAALRFLSTDHNGPSFRLVFTRGLVMDGNFKLAHVKQKNPDDDVWLADGHGMVAEDGPYRQHIKNAVEIREVNYSNIE
jgi:hypothetical protein